MEHAVSTSHLNEVALQTILAVYPHSGTVERYHGSVALELHILIAGALRSYTLYSVSLVEGEQGEAHSGNLLLARMNAIFQSGIHKHRHSHVLVHLFRLCLLFAQESTVILLPVDEAIVVRRYLTEIEREVTPLPFFSPSLYHAGEEVGIVAGAAHVLFALIPYHTTHGDAGERMEHTVVEHRSGAVF